MYFAKKYLTAPRPDHDPSITRVKHHLHKGKKAVTVKSTPKPTIDAAPLLQMLKKTLEGYDLVIATLIPETTAAARTINEKGGSAHFVSNNRTSV
jgi:hypothetical protein